LCLFPVLRFSLFAGGLVVVCPVVWLPLSVPVVPFPVSAFRAVVSVWFFNAVRAVPVLPAGSAVAVSLSLFLLLSSASGWCPVASFFSLVGFSGSRFPLPPGSVLCASSVLSSFAPSVAAAGGSFAVGCCPSGLDRVVRSAASRSALPLRVFSVSGVRSAAALRGRSLRLVAAVSCLFVFPRSVSFVRFGSWLCVFAAARRGVPVFVFLPSASLSSLPCVGGVVSWRVVSGASLSPSLSAFSFFAPVVGSVELSLL